MILIVSLQEDDGKKHTFNIVSRKLAISQRADIILLRTITAVT